MALRLDGEVPGVVRGLDGQGWVRSVEVGDAAPGLRVAHQGSGQYGIDITVSDADHAVRLRRGSSAYHGYIGMDGDNLCFRCDSGRWLRFYGFISFEDFIGSMSAAVLKVRAENDLQMEGNQKGLIVRTSGGARYRIRVDDSGAVISEAVA